MRGTRGGAARAALGALVLSGALLGATALYLDLRRPAREARVVRLFGGVEHRVEIHDAPRPMIVHVVSIDLATPGLRFQITPGEPTGGRMLPARTTSAFLTEFGCQLALNANYFAPFRSESPFDVYPRPGDGVDLLGLAAAGGQLYASAEWVPGTLYLSATNEASFDAPIGPLHSAISGHGFLVRSGTVAPEVGDSPPYPRTAVALDAGARRLLWFVIDGKQPGYSEGATLRELATIMIAHGAHDGIRLDEGGSTTLVREAEDGGAELLNSPINHRVPGWERVVGNHLGVYVAR